MERTQIGGAKEDWWPEGIFSNTKLAEQEQTCGIFLEVCWNNVGMSRWHNERGIMFVVSRASGGFAGRSMQSAVGCTHDGMFTMQHTQSIHIFACQRTVGSSERPCSLKGSACVGNSSSLRAGFDSCQLPAARPQLYI